MNESEWRTVLESPASSPAQKKIAEQKLAEIRMHGVRFADASPEAWPVIEDGPTLADALPHRFPALTESAYKRSVRFQTGIMLGGLAREILEHLRYDVLGHVPECSIDSIRRFALHHDHDKLKELWLAANEVTEHEYWIDDAYRESESSYRFFHGGLIETGEALADLIYEGRDDAQSTYTRLASEYFPPDPPKQRQPRYPMTPTRRPEDRFR